VRAVLVAAVAALALVAVHLAAGGGDFVPRATADPCAPRPERERDAAERIALPVLDGAACELGVPREELLIALLERRVPEGATEDELARALEAGVLRARREEVLSADQATALTLALRLGGARALVDLLLRR